MSILIEHIGRVDSSDIYNLTDEGVKVLSGVTMKEVTEYIREKEGKTNAGTDDN